MYQLYTRGPLRRAILGIFLVGLSATIAGAAPEPRGPLPALLQSFLCTDAEEWETVGRVNLASPRNSQGFFGRSVDSAIATLPGGLKVPLLRPGQGSQISLLPKASVGESVPGLAATAELLILAVSPQDGGSLNVRGAGELLADHIPVRRGQPVILRVPVAPENGELPPQFEFELSPGSSAVAVMGVVLRVPQDKSHPQELQAHASEVAAESYRIRDYFPLEVGQTWKMVDKADGGKTYEVRAEAHEPVGSTPVIALRRLDMADEYDLMSAAGILTILRRKSDRNGLMDYSDAPIPFAGADIVRVGEKWTVTPQNFRNPITNAPFKWTVKVRKPRPLKTPAGTFTDVIRLQFEAREQKLGLKVGKFQVILARGIGMVGRVGFRINSDGKKQHLKELLAQRPGGSV